MKTPIKIISDGIREHKIVNEETGQEFDLKRADAITWHIEKDHYASATIHFGRCRIEAYAIEATENEGETRFIPMPPACG